MNGSSKPSEKFHAKEIVQQQLSAATRSRTLCQAEDGRALRSGDPFCLDVLMLYMLMVGAVRELCNGRPNGRARARGGVSR